MTIQEYVSMVLESTPDNVRSIQFEIKTKAARNPKTKETVVRVAEATDYSPTGMVRFRLDRKLANTHEQAE